MTKTHCRTCGFTDCLSVKDGGECPRWAPETSTKPVRVIWHVIEPQLRADVASCQDCRFHFEDGTVTLCEEHERLDINLLFDRL